jgi:hypothetical protein
LGFFNGKKKMVAYANYDNSFIARDIYVILSEQRCRAIYIFFILIKLQSKGIMVGQYKKEPGC